VSVEAAAIVLHHFPTVPAEVPGVGVVPGRQTVKLVLLGIANHDGDGGAWPSLKTLAKYAECSRDTARRALRVLEHMSAIKTSIKAGGTMAMRDEFRTNLYEFLLICPAGCDGSKSHNVSQPDLTDPSSDRDGTPAYSSAHPPLTAKATPPSAVSAPPAYSSAGKGPLKVLEESREGERRPAAPKSPPPPIPEPPNPEPRAEQRAAPPPTYVGRCPAHGHHPSPPNCHGCRDARIAHEAARPPAHAVVKCHAHLVEHRPGGECPMCRADRIAKPDDAPAPARTGNPGLPPAGMRAIFDSIRTGFRTVETL